MINKSLDWYVAYTNSRSEKKVNLRLQQLGVESFLPLQEVKKKWSDRIKTLEVPLFPNYIFVKTCVKKLPSIENMKGICKFIVYNRQFAKVKEEEITSIKRILESKKNIEILGLGFTSGDKVKVKVGHLEGMCGKLIRRKSKQYFVVELEEMQKQLLMDIPVNYLELI